ncbi:MAG: aspartate kinase [Bacteroidota bacterium]
MKFGGASVKDAAAIRNVSNIILQHQEHPCLIVISAMDKTTNHLENLAHLARDQKEVEALDQFKRIKRFHHGVLTDLFGDQLLASVVEKVNGFFTEIERIVQGILLLEEFPSRTYDRIVSYGEILSTTIVSEYLRREHTACEWIDARTLVKTDANHKQAGVIWSLTQENISREIQPKMKKAAVVITQGFIGSTTNGRTTTLGREGSDYTASIFAHCLNADKLVVWKDVPGILNGDPRIREKTVKIDNLSYEEAVEMTFYGASVIHPKTIKPIFNKQIPLQVKCFLDTKLPGTEISSSTNAEEITSYIVKKNQAFISIKPRDFSFMEERLMQTIFEYVYKTGLKVNLVQNSAISLMLCVDDKAAQISAFESLLLDQFSVDIRKGLKLYTMINFSVKDLKEASEAVMVQQHENKLYIVK